MVLVFIGLLFLDCSVDAADEKAAISRFPMADVSVGAAPGPGIAATTKEGDQVAVDKTGAKSSLVSGAEAQRSFIQKHLLNIADETGAPVAPSEPAPVQKSANIEVKEANKEPAAVVTTPPNTTPAPAKTAPPHAVPPPVAKISPPALQPAVPKAAAEKPQSILQMIEGHEEEFKIGLLIAVGSFVVGWICGGSYYVRRERKRRGKLRF